MTHPLIAKQRIDDAAKSVAEVAKKRLEESDENQRSYEKFYNNLALLSGGTVALSVTYLGFLKTLSSQPVHLRWLVASWVMLFACLVCATFYAFFNTTYSHYARGREYAQRLKEQNETLAEEIPHVSIVGIESKEELEVYIRKLREAAGVREKDIAWASRKERFYGFLFRVCGVMARITFVVGLGLLLYFAATNMNTSPKGSETREGATVGVIQLNSPKAVEDKVMYLHRVGRGYSPHLWVKRVQGRIQRCCTTMKMPAGKCWE